MARTVVSVVHYRSKGLFRSLCTAFLDGRLDLECLSSHRQRNEYQQVAGQREQQKYRIQWGIQQLPIGSN